MATYPQMRAPSAQNINYLAEKVQPVFIGRSSTQPIPPEDRHLGGFQTDEASVGAGQKAIRISMRPDATAKRLTQPVLFFGFSRNVAKYICHCYTFTVRTGWGIMSPCPVMRVTMAPTLHSVSKGAPLYPPILNILRGTAAASQSNTSTDRATLPAFMSANASLISSSGR